MAVPSLDPVCPRTAPAVAFDAVALPVPLSYNHWGDFDPLGQLLAPREDAPALLQDVAGKLHAAGMTALAQDTQALATSLAGGDAAGAAGRLVARATSFVATFAPGVAGAIAARNLLTGQAVAPTDARFDTSELARPYVVRAHLGECVTVRLWNLLPEPVGLQATGLVQRPGAGSAVGLDPPDLAAPGGTRAFSFFIPDLPGMEGAHLLASGADERHQVRHGLYGAIVAEPHHAAWLTPDGAPSHAGPEAMVVSPHGADFREFVLFYQDEALLYDRLLAPLPILDPTTGAYGPGTKAINLRSEPLMDRFQELNRLRAAGTLAHGMDKSLAFSTYANGEPGTFVPRAYVGDPTKFRLLDAGPSQHHMHHLHGGGDRWRADPLAGDTQFDDGLVKDNPVPAAGSARIDVQDIGPGESYSAEIEGGAGGVQQAPGDYLFHCHIVEHYIAGMWSLWRVFNTLQPGLAPLPDRPHVPAAVDSAHLLGHRLPDGTRLTAANLDGWVRAQLPPPGVPGDEDASVWDWAVAGTAHRPLYLGEPASNVTTPDAPAASPGQRPPILFDPDNGRLAYPLLAPHVGKRPPFAPGPAPYLGADADARHPDGLCPAGARPINYAIDAMAATVHYNDRDVDPRGEVFALATDRAAIANGTLNPPSLVVRANRGDCIDILLASFLPEPAGTVRKVDMHTHLVQFDVQGSDGIVIGSNFEQGVRPVPTTGIPLAAPAAAGDAFLHLTRAAAFHPGAAIGVGLGEPDAEVATVAAVSGADVALAAPLARPHAAAAWVGTEFVRYRWFADVELGMVYWHDHVDGLNSWQHGLFGGLVVEPKASQWCLPGRPASAAAQCGASVAPNGHVMDIVSADAARVADGNATFRELVLQYQDRGCLSVIPLCTAGGPFPLPPRRTDEPASFNLRSAPLRLRNQADPMLDMAMPPGGTHAQGPPATDMLQAYPGDPTVIRLLYGGQSMTRGVATFQAPGNPFRTDADGRLQDALTFGISSQKNLRLACGAGGCLHAPGDSLYGIAQADARDRGAWGILRVLDPTAPGPAKLPSNPSPAVGSPPLGAPVRHYDVVALRANVTLNARQGTATVAPLSLFALASDEAAIRAGTLAPEPLVLRMLPGEVLEVTLTNRLAVPVGFTVGMLAPLTAQDLGLRIGQTNGTVAAPGGSAVYRAFADRELGAARVTSYAHLLAAGAVADPAMSGLYGAVVVEPAGSAFGNATGAQAVLTLADGALVREAVLQYASTDSLFDASAMTYHGTPQGLAMVNYRTEPLAGRVGSTGEDGCDLDNNACTVGLAQLDLRNPLLPAAFAAAPPQTPLLAAGVG
ncbi:MAG: hypothetical protein QOI63_1638, partial [Thermoplasmata archaeon]|nr:hypothetical protein [Thermoplasmata archaeon]